MPDPSGSVLKIDSSVPFDHLIHAWTLWHHNQVEAIVKPSRRYEKPYLAWETVRRRKNPFFEHGTGFEGYFVGRARTPDEALDSILTINQAILDNIARQYRGDYAFQSRLMQVLHGSHSDPKAVYIWAAELGAALARLRASASTNPEAEAFHTDTYRLVNMLPPIAYHEEANTIHQLYTIAGSSSGDHRILVTPQALPPSRQHAWMVAQLIGRFGHPLVREYLRLNPVR
jgi:hypothetical protein